MIDDDGERVCLNRQMRCFTAAATASIITQHLYTRLARDILFVREKLMARVSIFLQSRLILNVMNRTIYACVCKGCELCHRNKKFWLAFGLIEIFTYHLNLARSKLF